MTTATTRPTLVLAARVLRGHRAQLDADLTLTCSCGKWRQHAATPGGHDDHVAAQLDTARLLAP